MNGRLFWSIYELPASASVFPLCGAGSQKRCIAQPCCFMNYSGHITCIDASEILTMTYGKNTWCLAIARHSFPNCFTRFLIFLSTLGGSFFTGAGACFSFSGRGSSDSSAGAPTGGAYFGT